MIDLTPFCFNRENEHRPDLAKPFTRDGFTWASDSLIALRVPQRGDVGEDGADVTRIAPFFEGIEAREWRPLDEVLTGRVRTYPGTLDMVCMDCDGSGKIVPCDKCSGLGECSCPTCGGGAECQSCSGRGCFPWVEGRGVEGCGEPVECDDCDGSGISWRGKAPVVCVEAGPLWIDEVLLTRCRTLPGLMVAFYEGADGPVLGYGLSGPMLLRFDGDGYGAVMPIRPPKEDDAPAKEEAVA